MVAVLHVRTSVRCRRPQLTWSDFVEEYLTMLDDESEEANVLTLRGYTVLDEIEPFLENPLNLNTATAEDFRALGLLDEAQIDSLLRIAVDCVRCFARRIDGRARFRLSPTALAFALHLRR